MKKLGLTILGSLILVLLPSYFSMLPGATSRPVETLTYQEFFDLDTLTIYNPSTTQCDGDPLITASNRHIDTKGLREGSVRWMAVSRDLLQRWGGALAYGDTVVLHAGDSGIDGIWVIQDTMHKRYTKRGDLLFDCKTRNAGLWTGVKIVREKTYSLTNS